MSSANLQHHYHIHNNSMSSANLQHHYHIHNNSMSSANFQPQSHHYHSMVVAHRHAETMSLHNAQY